MNISSHILLQIDGPRNQNVQISAQERDTVDAEISRGAGEHASRDDDHTRHDSLCCVNPDFQHCQFQDGKSHNNAVVPGDDTVERVAKIEFSDPKVHENTLRIKIGRPNSVALLVIDTGAALSIRHLTE